MHNFAQFRFNWQSIQRSLRIKWAWRPNCPLTPEKGWSLLVTLTLHWPNSVTNLAMNPAVACVCRLIAVFCLRCFLFRALLLNSITESFTIKKKNCLDNHFCKWTLPSNRPLFNVGDISKMWTSCEGASCLNLSNCAVLLHILLFIVSLKTIRILIYIQQNLKKLAFLLTSLIFSSLPKESFHKKRCYIAIVLKFKNIYIKLTRSRFFM